MKILLLFNLMTYIEQMHKHLLDSLKAGILFPCRFLMYLPNYFIIWFPNCPLKPCSKMCIIVMDFFLSLPFVNKCIVKSSKLKKTHTPRNRLTSSSSYLSNLYWHENSWIQFRRISKSQEQGIYIYVSFLLNIKTRPLQCWSYEKAINWFGTEVANFSSVVINVFKLVWKR